MGHIKASFCLLLPLALCGCPPAITPLPAQPPCDRSADCAAGYYCDTFQSRCVPDDRPPPFGFDAGRRPDAGLDAGDVPDVQNGPDAGLDAGLPDVVVDAGPQNPLNPIDVAATTGYGTVTVTFTYPVDNADLCELRRQLGAAPGAPEQGVLVATGTEQGPLVDDDPPIETEVGYSVFCAQGGLFATVTAGNLVGPLSVKPPWHFPGWQKRHRVRFLNAARPTALDDFVVPVFIDPIRYPGIGSALTSGADVRFVDIDGTVLPFDVEGWNQATTTGVFWVRVPTVDASSDDDSILVYYGNAAALPAPNAGQTFADHLAVLHFNQVAVNAVADLTASGTGYIPSVENPPGRILGSYLFSSATSAQLNLTGGTPALPAFTYSAWIKIRNLAAGQRFFEIPGQLTVGRDANTTAVSVTGNLGGAVDLSGGEVVTLGPFHHVVVSGDGATVALYVDGVMVGSATAAGLTAQAGAVSLGGGAAFFDGWFDEVRLRAGARGADWVDADFAAGQDLFVDAARDAEEDEDTP